MLNKIVRVLVWHVKFAEHIHWPDCLRRMFSAFYGALGRYERGQEMRGIFDGAVGALKSPPGNRLKADVEICGLWAVSGTRKTKQYADAT
jgi:hypothetical protein